MLILTLRTDKPEAELGLYQDATQLAALAWPAHRQLAETIHLKIKELLESQGRNLGDLQGIAAYQGPGSFTGLRIGLSVANALADALQLPITAAVGENWQNQSIAALQAGHDQRLILPAYGADPHITTPVK